jgi:hypothetical protein
MDAVRKVVDKGMKADSGLRACTQEEWSDFCRFTTLEIVNPDLFKELDKDVVLAGSKKTKKEFTRFVQNVRAVMDSLDSIWRYIVQSEKSSNPDVFAMLALARHSYAVTFGDPIKKAHAADLQCAMTGESGKKEQLLPAYFSMTEDEYKLVSVVQKHPNKRNVVALQEFLKAHPDLDTVVVETGEWGKTKKLHCPVRSFTVAEDVATILRAISGTFHLPHIVSEISRDWLRAAEKTISTNRVNASKYILGLMLDPSMFPLKEMHEQGQVFNKWKHIIITFFCTEGIVEEFRSLVLDAQPNDVDTDVIMRLALEDKDLWDPVRQTVMKQ